MTDSLRTETEDRVRVITLTRADEYNTINPALRDALGDALDEADHDRGVNAVLLRAEGPAFCAGYQLDWATSGQARDASERRARVGFRRRSPGDQSLRGDVGEVAFDLEADDRRGAGVVHRGRHQHGAQRRSHRVQRVGPVRLSADAGVGDTRGAVGVDRAARSGARAKRYLFTGDEISGTEAASLGLVLECVANDDLDLHARALAHRIALLPLEQLQMIKWALNDTARQMYAPDASRMLGSLFDGVARHTQEGLDFVERSVAVGFRQAVRERDDPFGDYGSRPRT